MKLKFRSLVMEYGFESHPYLNPTHRFSIALQLSPAVVSITKTTISHNPIFRSLHRYYESEPFIKVGLKKSSGLIYFYMLLIQTLNITQKKNLLLSRNLIQKLLRPSNLKQMI